MPQLADALSHLAEIHAHLAKGETYRGLTARPVALSGLVGLVAAAWQKHAVAPGDAAAFTWYWLAAGTACALIGCSGAILKYAFEEDALTRRRARIVAGQFLPCVVGGLLLTLALRPQFDHCVGLLPGWWSVLYGLGLFSARPYLPRATGWVALFYLTAGIVLAALLPTDAVPSPWTIALVFCAGQFALAGVLHRNEQREVADVS